MNDRKVAIILVAILVSLIAIIVGWMIGQRSKSEELPVEVEVSPEIEPVPEGTGVVVDLYFPANEGQLADEQREVPEENDLARKLARLLGELLAGPESVELYAALPEEMEVGWTHVNKQNVVYIDIEMTGESDRPPWGSGKELQSVYSIVNTVLLNMPEITSVILLRNGQQRPTFAGHLDTSRPLIANRDLIATIEP